jgi:hypothetical protein
MSLATDGAEVQVKVRRPKPGPEPEPEVEIVRGPPPPPSRLKPWQIILFTVIAPIFIAYALHYAAGEKRPKPPCERLEDLMHEKCESPLAAEELRRLTAHALVEMGDAKGQDAGCLQAALTITRARKRLGCDGDD